MKRRLKCSHCHAIGHTIRSCKELRKKEGKNPDQILFDSLTFQDEESAVKIMQNALEEAERQDLGDITEEEEESQEMEMD